MNDNESLKVLSEIRDEIKEIIIKDSHKQFLPAAIKSLVLGAQTYRCILQI